MSIGEDLPKRTKGKASRRGARMNSRVGVAIQWVPPGSKPHVEEGFTRVVNGYGCLLVSPTEMNLAQPIRLTNLLSGETANGVVVWKGGRRNDGWEFGVELVSTNLEFWGIEL